jgi:hypothetical protein
MAILTCTKSDVARMNCVIACIEHSRAVTAESCPDLRVSDWVSQALLVEQYGISYAGINRLIELRMLDAKPSDGFGPSVKINPEWRKISNPW